jgi:hypothetical protein
MRYRAGVRAPAHVALRAALRQGWFAFLPECLTLRATHVAYRATPRLLGSQPAPAGMCSREDLTLHSFAGKSSHTGQRQLQLSLGDHVQHAGGQRLVG